MMLAEGLHLESMQKIAQIIGQAHPLVLTLAMAVNGTVSPVNTVSLTPARTLTLVRVSGFTRQRRLLWNSLVLISPNNHHYCCLPTLTTALQLGP